MKTADALPRLEELKKTHGNLPAALSATAAETGVSVDALRMADRRSPSTSPMPHGNAVLSREEDTALVALAQAFSINNMPLSALQLRDLVLQRWGHKVSRAWVPRWVKRHKKELSQRSCKALADKRAGPQVMESVDGFCNELDDLLKTHHFTPAGIMNYDETRVDNKGGKMVTKRIHMTAKERSNALATRHSTVASLLTFIAADGSVFLSVYVMKAKFVEGEDADVQFRLHAAPRTSRRSWPRFYCWTETGFLDGDTFSNVVDLVAAEWAVRNPSTNLLLFGDRLGAHMRPATLEKALERKVYLFFLPPNASHFIQPLDASPFGSFHVVMRGSNEQLTIDGMMTNTGTRDSLLASAFVAERKAFEPHIVREAFRTTGLFPFDRAVIIARAKENLGVGEDATPVVDQARAAAAEVIRASRERVSEAAKEVRAGEASVQRAILHSPEALLEQDRQRTAERLRKEKEVRQRAVERVQRRENKVKKRAEKAAARVSRTCRSCVKKEHRGGGGWHVCACGSFRLCPGCKRGATAAVEIAQHGATCSASEEPAAA